MTLVLDPTTTSVDRRKGLRARDAEVGTPAKRAELAAVFGSPERRLAQFDYNGTYGTVTR